MAIFVMLGKYSSVESVQEISAERTTQLVGMVKNFGGEIKAIYALLGDNDILIVLELPGSKQAMRISVAFYKLTGISFTTSEALSVAEFDKLMSGE